VKEPFWLTRAMVETAHADQIRERGGLHGIRDAGLLESALARPQHRWSHDREAEIIALAACYGFGRTKNHALLDGNKRIGFVAMNMFLILNGYEIDAPESEAVDAMLRVAGGLLDEAALTDWLGGVVVRMSG
jgi:death-on-curing protein